MALVKTSGSGGVGHLRFGIVVNQDGAAAAAVDQCFVRVEVSPTQMDEVDATKADEGVTRHHVTRRH